MDQELDFDKYRANRCTLGLAILYGVNSFATTVMNSKTPSDNIVDTFLFENNMLTRWDSR